MTNKYFKSKLGILFSGAYLLLTFVVIVEIMTGPPDAMSGLAMMVLAMPWSFMLFEALDAIAPSLLIFGFALYAFCVLLNAAILYCLGLSLSVLGSWVNRRIDRSLEAPRD